MDLNKKCYIYLLIDPIDHTPKYVGASVNPHKRLREHFGCRTYKETSHFSEKDRWIWLLYRAGLEPSVKVIFETTLEHAREVETKFIQEYSTRYYLLNCKDDRKYIYKPKIKKETKPRQVA